MKTKTQNKTDIVPIQTFKKKFNIDEFLSDDNFIFIAKIMLGAVLITNLSSILTQNSIYKETYLNMDKNEELRTSYYIQQSDILSDGTINNMDFFNTLSQHEQKRILYLKRQGYNIITNKLTSVDKTKEMFNKLQNTKLTQIQKSQIEKELLIIQETKDILSK